MTIALYRRYRPDTFAEVIGQDHVTSPIRAALRANRVTHAYLFSGPRGCGKTTSARILARCLNCAEGPTDTPCGQCDSCRELATGGPGSLDVVEIDAASHGGVDDARDLRERATSVPVRDRYRIFIIDEAHMVTPQGFNALLKLVEEPPDHVKFVFATTEPDKVLGTIRSRTHHYPFRLVPPDVLEPYLQSLADDEHIRVADGVLPLVMREGGGSVRDTLSILDQLMAGAIDSEVSYRTAVSLLGYTDTALLDETVEALAAGEGAGAYRVVEQMVDSGHDPRRFVEDLLQRLRDLLIISVAGDRARDVLTSVPADQWDRMVSQVAAWNSRGLSRAADLADEALRQMVGATSPRLQLELLIGRLLVEPAPAGAPAATSIEDAPAQSRFGAREAREALARSKRQRSQASAGQRDDSSRVPSHGSTAGTHSPSAPPQRDDDRPVDHPSPLPRDRHSPDAQAPSGWPSAAVPGTPVAPTGRSRERDDHEADSERGRSTQASDPPDRGADARPIDARDPFAGSTPGGTHQIRSRWTEIVAQVESLSRVTRSLIGNARLGAVNDSTVELLFPSEGMAMNLSRGNRAAEVAGAIRAVTGLSVTVRAQVGHSGAQQPDSQVHEPLVDPAYDAASEPPPFEPVSRPRLDEVGGSGAADAPTSQQGWPTVARPMDAPPADSAPLDNTPLDAAPVDAAPEPSPRAMPVAPAELTASAAAAEPVVPTEPAAPTGAGVQTQTVSVFTYDDVPSAPIGGWAETVSLPGGEVTFEDEAPAWTANEPATRSPRMRAPEEDAPAAPAAPAFDDAEDTPSVTDDDIEMNRNFGVPAVLEILGGTIIDTRTDERGL